MAGALHQYLAGLTLVDRCGKCGNVGHNRKGCRGQGGATQAAGARTVSGQGVQEELLVQGMSLVRQVQDKLLVQGMSMVKQVVQVIQHSAAPSTASQGPTQRSAGLRQGFQAPRPEVHGLLREFRVAKSQCRVRSAANRIISISTSPSIGKKLNIATFGYNFDRRHFKTLSLDELRSPDFNLLSDQEYSEEEEEEAMAETMEQYMSKTRTDYGSGVARPKIDNKDQFELKGQFLKELRENTFSGSDNEDANEHIEKVLKIVDLFHVPNITVDQLMLRVFPISLTGAASRWLRNEPTGSIKTWEDLKTKFLNKYCPKGIGTAENEGNQQLSAKIS
ncbi:hypothetical protein Tco_0655073 [Tanacetum coccineum]|uniref:Retrotransposon gag domain-containing protein n=1 Tax=Tanacetum coccineum TaxID=301880 RepID=A0ABQ4X4Z2_9ASTR